MEVISWTDEMTKEGRNAAKTAIRKLNLPEGGPKTQEQINEVILLQAIVRLLQFANNLGINAERRKEIVSVAIEASDAIDKAGRSVVEKFQEHGRN